MRTAEKKKLLSELKEKTENCLSSRKHANDLIDIISKLQDDDETTIISCIRSVSKLFCHYIEVGEMVMDGTKDSTNEDKYRTWLRARYQDTINSLLEMLEQTKSNIQELSLSVLMKYLTKESYHLLNAGSKTSVYFSLTLYKNILQSLISESIDNSVLINRFQEYLDYDDVRYYTLKLVIQECQSKLQNKKVSDVWLGNAFCVLEMISVPSVKKETRLKHFLCQKPDEIQKIFSVTEHKKLYTNAWVEYLKFKLTGVLYRKVLTIVHEKIMPNFTSPLLLSDFLIESYSIGGAISLLAMNGLFILIQKHNLHYPDFYPRLYALFEPSVFHVKYKARFFHLADLFLSSSHLPSYLVAAFIKRLARISLSAPPSGLLISVPLIINLIIRHPTCKQLIHRPDREMDFAEDPYDHNEPDPAKCRALESCLWELKTLQNHYHPDVIKLTKKIEHGDIPDMEMDLSEKLDTTPGDLFEKECSKKMKTTAVTFEPPKGLFGTKDNRLNICWTL